MSRLLLCAIAIAPLVLAGCTDNIDAMREAREHPLHVVCHSGGIVILDDFSIADVEWRDSGGFYRSRTTSKLIKIGTECILIDEAVPNGWKPLLPGRPR